jgi:hypothetical protein
MKKIEVAYKNPAIASAIHATFANEETVELIDKTPRGKDDANSIDEYLPTPRPIGMGPDQLISLHDFVIAIIASGSYDLIKFALGKAITAVKSVLITNTPNGIIILTSGITSRWKHLKRHYSISFSIPYEYEMKLSKVDALADDIKKIDKSFKIFLRKNEDRLSGFRYRFEFNGERWILRIDSAN